MTHHTAPKRKPLYANHTYTAPHAGRSVSWLRIAGLLCLFGLAIPFATQAPRASASANWSAVSSVNWAATPQHVQADLWRTAAAHPSQTVRVIVQGQSVDRVSADVRAVGGHIAGTMSIIHAVTANLSGRAILRLASRPSVRWISADSPTKSSNYSCCSAATLQQVYDQSIHASDVWGTYEGTGIGVAVVDSGLGGSNADLNVNTIAQVNVNPAYHHHTTDLYGHGTHVAGIIAGTGTNSSGAYVGVAPNASLINVRVSDDNGAATVSDVVNGLQWIYNNASQYNIRVVNLSLNSTVADSYQVDPLDAAIETLWQSGIVVVASAGNNGTSNSGVMYAPANDPFVITVGAVNDQGTVSTSDDTLASFSAYGTVPVSTTTGATISINKPDLVAPGMNIISDLAGSSVTLAIAHPDHIVTVNGCICYFSMSGTSMAAPMVSGAVALLLQAHPGLTPNQVKYILTSTATPLSSSTGTGAGEVNVAAAIASATTSSANGNLALAASLQAGNPAALWGSASWGSASWGSASWGSASWGSASWGSASWGSDYWGQ